MNFWNVGQVPGISSDSCWLSASMGSTHPRLWVTCRARACTTTQTLECSGTFAVFSPLCSQCVCEAAASLWITHLPPPALWLTRPVAASSSLLLFFSPFDSLISECSLAMRLELKVKVKCVIFWDFQMKQWHQVDTFYLTVFFRSSPCPPWSSWVYLRASALNTILTVRSLLNDCISIQGLHLASPSSLARCFRKIRKTRLPSNQTCHHCLLLLAIDRSAVFIASSWPLLIIQSHIFELNVRVLVYIYGIDLFCHYQSSAKTT